MEFFLFLYSFRQRGNFQPLLQTRARCVTLELNVIQLILKPEVFFYDSCNAGTR